MNSYPNSHQILLGRWLHQQDSSSHHHNHHNHNSPPRRRPRKYSMQHRIFLLLARCKHLIQRHTAPFSSQILRRRLGLVPLRWPRVATFAFLYRQSELITRNTPQVESMQVPQMNNVVGATLDRRHPLAEGEDVSWHEAPNILGPDPTTNFYGPELQFNLDRLI